MPWLIPWLGSLDTNAVSFALLYSLRHHWPDYASRRITARLRFRTHYHPRRSSLWCGGRIRGGRICVCRLRWSRLSRLSTSKNSRAPEFFIQSSTRSSFPGARPALRNHNLRISPRVTTLTARQFSASLRLGLDYSAGNSFVFETASSSVGITKVSAWHSCYATPGFVIGIVIGPPLTRIIMAASTTSTAVTWSSLVVTIITRVWIAVVIRQRIPADVVSE
jgi:hypothetical protein